MSRAITKLTGPPQPRHGLFLPTIMAGRAAAMAAGVSSVAAAIWRGITLSFYMLLRASEIFAYDDGLVHPDFCIRIADIDFRQNGRQLPLTARATADEVRVTLRGSKNDQQRKGACIPLTMTNRGPADPVQIMIDLCDALPPGIDGSYPLLSVRDQHGRVRCVTRTEAGHAIKALASAAGLNPDNYHTHSLRAGGATTLAHKRVPDRLIKQAGRWRSDTYRDYIRDNLDDYRRITGALATSAAAAPTIVHPPASTNRR